MKASRYMDAADAMMKAWSEKEQAWKEYQRQPSRGGVLDAHTREMAFRKAQEEFRYLQRELDLEEAEVK